MLYEKHAIFYMSAFKFDFYMCFFKFTRSHSHLCAKLGMCIKEKSLYCQEFIFQILFSKL